MKLLKKIEKVCIGKKAFQQKYCEHDYKFIKRHIYTNYNCFRGSSYSYYYTEEGDLYKCPKCGREIHENTKTLKKEKRQHIRAEHSRTYTLIEITDYVTGKTTRDWS